MSKHWVHLSVVIIFSLLGIKALFHPGLFTAHDIWHQVVRFHYFYQSINDGQFPPYWVDQLANGFGYPLFTFSYNLPWLIGVLFLKIGFDLSTSIKFLFGLSYLLSGVAMYLFTYSLLRDKLSALLSSIVYLWLPYHFLIIFVSASMGVAFVFFFLPIVLLGIHLLSIKSNIGILILGIGLSGIILSHIMHLVFTLPLVLIFITWELTIVKSKVLFIKNIILGIMITTLVTSFYLIPAFSYNQLTRVNEETGITKLYERNFINFNQLIYSKWGFSPIVNNAKNGEISFQLGITQWISVISLLLLIIFKKLNELLRSKTAGYPAESSSVNHSSPKPADGIFWFKDKNDQSLSIYLLISFIICIILMLDYSLNLWKFFIKFVSLDFPFRLLLPATFIASLSSGIVLKSISNNLKILILIFLILLTVYTNRNHINVNQYTNFPLKSYLELETEKTTNTFNEYLPVKANPKLLNKPWNEIVGENLSVNDVSEKTNTLSFFVTTSKNQIAHLGQFYFPGQTLYIDNKISPFDIDRDGLISFMLPQGTHSIMVKYEETPVIKVSKFLTFLGILTVLHQLAKNLNKKFTFN